MGCFIPVWLFSRSDPIWTIFQFLGCQRYNKIKTGQYSQEPINLSQIFLDKCSHGHNSTESNDKDWTFISTHHQCNNSPVSDLRQQFVHLIERKQLLEDVLYRLRGTLYVVGRSRLWLYLSRLQGINVLAGLLLCWWWRRDCDWETESMHS